MRRKELKKNKKQRLQVRQAVIKQKDPKHLLNDMELLDKMGKFEEVSCKIHSFFIVIHNEPFKNIALERFLLEFKVFCIRFKKQKRSKPLLFLVI